MVKVVRLWDRALAIRKGTDSAEWWERHTQPRLGSFGLAILVQSFLETFHPGKFLPPLDLAQGQQGKNKSQQLPRASFSCICFCGDGSVLSDPHVMSVVHI